VAGAFSTAWLEFAASVPPNKTARREDKTLTRAIADCGRPFVTGAAKSVRRAGGGMVKGRGTAAARARLLCRNACRKPAFFNPEYVTKCRTARARVWANHRKRLWDDAQVELWTRALADDKPRRIETSVGE